MEGKTTIKVTGAETPGEKHDFPMCFPQAGPSSSCPQGLADQFIPWLMKTQLPFSVLRTSFHGS